MNAREKAVLLKRVDKLIGEYQLTITRGTGAFGTDGGFYHKTEFLMHEVAHMLTLGHTAIPPQILSETVSNHLDRIGVKTRNALEIDTSYVVWRAGIRAGLWGPEFLGMEVKQLAASCANNLDGDERVSTWQVLAEFDNRSGDASLDDAAENLLCLLGCKDKNA